MKRIALAMVLTAAISGCSTTAPTTQVDHYIESSFEMCDAEVSIYSISDDGYVRVVCKDGSKYAMRDISTLQVMRNINIDYCSGGGLTKFSESSKYYSFKCRSGELINIRKRD